MTAQHPSRAKRVLVQLLAPLAPHLAEELWSRLGKPFSVHESTWPVPDRRSAGPPAAVIVVQLDGRVRTRITVDGERRRAGGCAAPRSTRQASNRRRVIYVPGKLVSLVT